jgi:hypothetical protein
MTIVHMDSSQRPLVVVLVIVTNAIVIDHSRPMSFVTTNYIYIYIFNEILILLLLLLLYNYKIMITKNFLF